MKWRVLLGALAGLSVPIPASAYVRTTTSSGTPIAWTIGCLDDQVDTTPNPQISTAREKAALQAALQAWNTADGPHTKRQVTLGPDISDPYVRFDGHSVVLWRLPGFCDDPANGSDEACLAVNATATTTVFFHDSPGAPDDGKIVEADMEVNAVHFEFDDHGAPDKIDMQEVFAHETGHGNGLDHTCYTDSAQTPLLDDARNPQPFCFPVSALPAGVTAAAMYPFTAPGETDKRGPTLDEVAAMTSIYASASGTCDNSSDDSSGGCSIVTGRRAPLEWGGLGGLALSALLLTVRRWRRR